MEGRRVGGAGWARATERERADEMALSFFWFGLLWGFRLASLAFSGDLGEERRRGGRRGGRRGRADWPAKPARGRGRPRRQVPTQRSG